MDEGETVGERIHWWWAGLVDWFRDRPYAWQVTRREAAERLWRTRWRFSDWALDVAHVLRSRLVWRRPLGARTETEIDVVTLRAAALAESEQLLEAQRARLATLEEWHTHRRSELRAREAQLDEERAQAQAADEWRRLELELREQEIRQREQALRREAEARHAWAPEPEHAASVGVPAVVTGARPHVDPEVASELRRAQHERRRG